MTKWLEQNKNIVLIIVLILFVLLALFFFFLIRPLAAEEETKRQELNRMNEDVSFFQDHLSQLTPQTFTEEEKDLLLESVPASPDVEDIVKDLEKTEIETGAVIDNITISIHPNELNPKEATSQENGNNQENGEVQETQPQTQTSGSWSHILPEETIKLLEEKEKLKDVKDLTVSYVELAIDINGEVKNVDQFIQKLETFKRITHVQSYDYSINEENGRLEGVITIRAFYSQDFVKLINEEHNFELDYAFDPSKIKRYIEPVAKEVESGSGALNAGENNSTNGENSSNVKEQPSGKTEPENSNSNNNQEQNLSKIDSTYKLYTAPETKREGEPVFLVVQTGAYSSTKYVNLAAKELIEIGVYPRVIGNDLFYVYTATDSSIDSAQKIVDKLKSKGFDSYVKTLPYRLTTEEKAALLKEADELVSTTTDVLTNGLTKNDYSLDEKQLNAVRSKIKTYENKVQEFIKNEMSESRKQELQESIAILKQLDQVLNKSVPVGNRESLWEAEGLLLDYMLILNSYVPSDIK